MSMERILAAACSVCLVAMNASMLRAQIDLRVNRLSTQDGHAHDAASQVGFGRYNLSLNGFDSGQRANAIVTGNVTGLGGFHDTTVPQFNQFRENLPSAGLSSFQGRSVGLGDVRTGTTFGNSYYFDRQQTVPDAGYILQGLNQPGSSTLRSTTFAPPAWSAPPAEDSETFRWRDPTDRRLGLSGSLRDYELARRNLVAEPTSNWGVDGSPTDRLPSRDPAWDMGIREPIREPAGQDYYRDLARTSLDDGAANDERLKQLDTRIPMERTIRPASEAIADARPGPVDQRIDPSAATRSLLEPAPGPETPGFDVFGRMYAAVRSFQEADGAALGFFAHGRPGEELLAADEESRLSEPAADRAETEKAEKVDPSSPAAIARQAAATRWNEKGLKDPIKTFVGKNEDRINVHMAQAEAALRRGEFYNAERQFELAHSMDKTNPLPILGQAHALVAAGDYASAVRELEQGISTFPQIAAFSMDLPALAGNQDTFDRRRADLERTLERQDDYQLRFLLGYLELYSGLTKLGMANLRLAAKAAPAGSVIAIFPDLLTGERSLPALPTRN